MTAGFRPAPGVRLLADGQLVTGAVPWRVLVLGRRYAAAARRTWSGEEVDPELVGLLAEHELAQPLPPSTDGPGPGVDEVTLVVPVHNDAARLERALRSVPAGVALVVVDDGSTDGSGDVATRLGAQVVRHEQARGPAAARNAGLRVATTRFVAFLDADVEADPSWLGTLLAHLDRSRVALVAPRVVARNPDDPALLARYESVMSPLDRGPTPAVVQPRGVVDFVPSAALVGRRSALVEVDGFDTSLAFGEDVDLCHRLHEAGWEVRYDPAAEVRHDHRTRWQSWLRRRYGYGTGAPTVAARHGSPQPAVPVAGALAAAVGLFGPGRLSRRITVAALLTVTGAARAAAEASAVGVPAAEAARGGLSRELTAAQRVVGLLPRQGYLPLSLAWAAMSRRGRRLVPAAVVLQQLKVWRARRPPLGAPVFVALRVLDEGAVGAGLLVSCARARTVRPLLPTLDRAPVVRRLD